MSERKIGMEPALGMPFGVEDGPLWRQQYEGNFAPTVLSSTVEQFSATLNQRWDEKSRDPYRDMVIAALGLPGEAGEVTEHFKKHIRDGARLSGNQDLLLEFGDVLHYLVRLIHVAGFTLQEVIQANELKLEAKRRKSGHYPGDQRRGKSLAEQCIEDEAKPEHLRRWP